MQNAQKPGVIVNIYVTAIRCTICFLFSENAAHRYNAIRDRLNMFIGRFVNTSRTEAKENLTITTARETSFIVACITWLRFYLLLRLHVLSAGSNSKYDLSWAAAWSDLPYFFKL